MKGKKTKSLLQDIEKSQVIKLIYSDHYNSLAELSLSNNKKIKIEQNTCMMTWAPVLSQTYSKK